MGLGGLIPSFLFLHQIRFVNGGMRCDTCMLELEEDSHCPNLQDYRTIILHEDEALLKICALNVLETGGNISKLTFKWTWRTMRVRKGVGHCPPCLASVKKAEFTHVQIVPLLLLSSTGLIYMNNIENNNQSSHHVLHWNFAESLSISCPQRFQS